MATPVHETDQLDASQERSWFVACTVILVLIFVGAGGSLSWMQWKTMREETRVQQVLMDPASPDPGVTPPVPTDTSQATRVQVGIYMDRIPELSIKEARWTGVFDLWFRWQGELADPGEHIVLMDGEIESKDKLAESHENGVHYVRYRVVADFTKLFSISRFPLDDHLLTVAVESGDQRRDLVLFVPDAENSSVSSRVSVPGYTLTRYEAIEKAHSYKTTRGDPRMQAGSKSTFSQYRFGLFLQREGRGLYFKMFQALFVAVGIAMLACFIKPTDVDPRFGLGVGGLFAAVANSYLVGGFVPDTGAFALADLVNLIGIVTILVTVIESTVSLYLFDRRGEEALSRRLDKAAFIIMSSCFIGLNVMLVLASSSR